ncbi:AraC family transcriptional regulator [Nocardioides stalactiti]|uniref:AraC family transcriptional regulator n=1 Tax=Nocardioides stalactiti TaxID=2755356 RepID=UPI001600234F|nr:AraC family transcriptional regulator [Nocardioides stalactiti]
MADRTLPVELVQATVALALQRGWDVNAMLGRVGFSPLLLAEGRARVTEDQLVRLVRELWRATDDELLGLGSHPLPRGSFRVLMYGVLGSADLGEALERTQSFLQAFPALRVSISTTGDETRIVVDYADAESDPEHLLAVTALMVSHRVVAWGVKHRFELDRVELPFPQPRYREALDTLFASPLVFGSRSAAIVFDSRMLRRPIMRDAGEVEAFVAAAPAGLLTRPTYAATTVAARVRQIVEPATRKGSWPSADDVAAKLLTSPQTLRRWLAAEGSSYRAVSDEVRRDAAIASLVRGEEPIVDLAQRLGFSEASAFTRAFRRWTGSTPGAYRTPVTDPEPATPDPEHA